MNSVRNYKIRFNTKFSEGNPKLKWRIVDEREEILAENIKIYVPTFTTEDTIETGETKWHLSCQGTLSWEGANAVIK